jgi:Aspartyl/Asparaginyl beta-hydroxylase
MKNFLKLMYGMDALPLQLAIARRPELWAEDTFLRRYPQGPFGEVESIMLRFPEKVVFDESDPEAAKKLELYKLNRLPGFDQHESIDYPAYAKLPEARGLVMTVFGLVAGTRLGRVMVNKIKPGGRIFRHADTPVHTDYYSRFHVCLQSAPGVRFLAGDEETYMAPGEAWWFDNSQEHEVINNSNVDRIHLVIDAKCSK